MTTCTTESYCVALSVLQKQDEFGADPGWVAGAFVLGLLLGAGLTALCVRPALREWEKKKRQDVEKGSHVSSKSHMLVTAKLIKDDKGDEKKKSKKKKGGKYKKRKGDEEDDDFDYSDKINEKVPELSKGMVDVMVQSEEVDADIEIANQDLITVVAIENRQRKEKQTLQVQLLAILLRKHLDKRNITTPFYDGFIHKTRMEMADLNNLAKREKAEKEEELQGDIKLIKSPEALETEMQKVQTEYNNKLNQQDKDYRQKIREDLMRSSGLSDAEVDGIMDKLNSQLAAFESKKALEQARQRRTLEDRLAKRKQYVEYRNMLKEETLNDVDSQVEAYDELLAKYVDDGKIVERQKDEILKQYQHDLQELNHHHDKELTRQQLALAEKLRLRRMKQVYKLTVKQSKEEAILLQTAEKSTNTNELLQVYNDIIVKHHIEQEDLGAELDQNEIQELENLKQENVKVLNVAVAKEEERVSDKIGETAKLTRKEAEKVLLYHRKQLELYNLKKQHEKQAMISRLQQKLAQRMMRLEEDEQLDRVDEKKIKDQQTNTMEKVLASNIELNEEARQKIMEQHNQNMEALNNQLQTSKLRQTKSLELKLSQRKAKLAELQKKQSDLRHHTREINSKEREKIQTRLDIEIAEEEKKLEEHKAKAIADLKQQLVAETEQALRLQEEEIGQLLGRLQVGQARRKAILQKQDKTIQELQDQLERKVTEGGELPKSMSDQLMQEHYNQVTHLNTKLQRVREQQEQSLTQKIQSKKIRKERELEEQLQDEAEEESKLQNFHTKGFASHVMMQTLLEQRHRNEMSNLAQEMKSELEKDKENMNLEMELELQTELENHRQQLLTQLAAISNLSQNEIQDVVDSAVTDTGESQQKAKILAKDLRQEIKRAKSSLGMDGENNEYGYHRSKSGYGDQLHYGGHGGHGDQSELSYSSSKKSKGKKKFQPPQQPLYYDEGFEESGDDNF